MKKIILTGGSDGIGKAFGSHCHAQGIEIVCLSRSAPTYAATHIKTDLTEEKSIASAAEQILETHPQFDALINCAGVYSGEHASNLSYAELERVLKTNTLAPAFLTSRLFNAIVANEADILNVGSTIGTRASPNELAYGASKWALRGLNMNLQIELRKTKSRVILFSPGGIKTKLSEKFDQNGNDTSQYMDPDDIAKLMLHILQLPKSIEVSEILINRKDH